MTRSAALLLLLAASPLLSAGELPQLVSQPFLGQYAALEGRNLRFIVNVKGEGLLMPPKEKGGYVNDRFGVKFVPVIEETLPDGRVIGKRPVEDGWEAVTPASAEAKKVTYRGAIAGGATFEVNLEFDGGKVLAGGRILEKGTSANPLRFVLRMQVPNVYQFEKDAAKREAKLKKDRIDLVRADGKKLKLDLATPLDAESKEFSGPGVTQARIEMAGYSGGRFEIAAGPGGVIELWNKDAGALYEGFTMGWKHDAAKDPEGKARLTFELR